MEIQDYRELKPLNEILLRNLKSLTETKEWPANLQIGLDIFDRNYVRLNKSELIVIGGESGVGKTAFALNIVRNAALKEKAKVLFFSMGQHEPNSMLGLKLLSMGSRVPFSRLRDARALSENDWNRIYAATDDLEEAHICFDDTPDISLPEIWERARITKAVHDWDLVVIDGLRRTQALEEISSPRKQAIMTPVLLKKMAVEMDIPIVVIFHAEKQPGKDSQMIDLRHGTMARKADVFVSLYRENYHERVYDGFEWRELEYESSDCEVSVWMRDGRHFIGNIHFNSNLLLFSDHDGIPF